MKLKKFEYRCEEISETEYLVSSGFHSDREEDSIPQKWESLNRLGVEGWELITVKHIADHSGYYLAWFKRRLQNTTKETGAIETFLDFTANLPDGGYIVGVEEVEKLRKAAKTLEKEKTDHD